MTAIDWKKTYQPIADALGWHVDRLLNFVSQKRSEGKTNEEVEKLLFDMLQLKGKDVIFVKQKGEN